MIMPGNRLVRLFAATMLPAALAAAMIPDYRGFIAAACLLLCLVAVSDAICAARRRSGISAEFPERLNLTCGLQGVLSFVISEANGSGLSLIIGLHLPTGVSSPHTEYPLQLPGNSRGGRVDWPLTGVRRGSHLLEKCQVRVLSPLGLWNAQTPLPVSTQVRVYPNLRDERKRLANLFLNQNNRMIRPKRQVGQGREFEKLRLYLPGDGMGDIHWKATAKRGQLVTKEFQIERTQEVYVVIDASRLSARSVAAPGSRDGGEPLLERYIRAALVLGNVVHRQGDLFGVLSFSDRVLNFVRAKSGKSHFGACLDALYTLNSASSNPGYDEVASFLAARLKRRALVIFLTSLDEPALAEGFVRSIGVLNRRHLVSVVMLRPDHAMPLFSGKDPQSEEEMYRRLGGHLVWHGLREMKQTLRLRGVHLSLVEDERLSAEVVSGYLDVKRRQML